VTDRLGVIADIQVRRNDFLADPSFDLFLGVKHALSPGVELRPRVHARLPAEGSQEIQVLAPPGEWRGVGGRWQHVYNLFIGSPFRH
jgi:hypothetical protein